MRHIIAINIAAGSLIAGLGVSASALAAEQTLYQCTQGGVARRVEVIRDPAGDPVCEVWYDKPQESTTRQRLWSAANDPDYCAAQAEAFVEKLRGGGWTCVLADGAAADMAPADEAAPASEAEAAPETP